MPSPTALAAHAAAEEPTRQPPQGSADKPMGKQGQEFEIIHMEVGHGYSIGHIARNFPSTLQEIHKYGKMQPSRMLYNSK